MASTTAKPKPVPATKPKPSPQLIEHPRSSTKSATMHEYQARSSEQIAAIDPRFRRSMDKPVPPPPGPVPEPQPTTFWEKYAKQGKIPPAMEVAQIGRGQFRDALGRTLLLRGVNVGGNSKIPLHGETQNPQALGPNFGTSFVGRPFPLQDAEQHFARLRAWGFTFIRFVVTWEAIEHKGPGVYDEEYISYVRSVLEVANQYGLLVYIDAHQDSWSRWCGGDGAPKWTLDAVGFDTNNFEVTGAASLNQSDSGKQQFVGTSWAANGLKLAAATMFTLFWAGDKFAPKCLIEGTPVQAFLQNRYINAFSHLALAVKHLPNILGFGVMNEPLPGYIGCPTLEKHWGNVKCGANLTPFDGFACGAGAVVNAHMHKTSGASMGKVKLNEGRESAWKSGIACVWKQHGVWQLDGRNHPVLTKPKYFAHGSFSDFYLPFVEKYAAAIRGACPDALVFVESPPEGLGVCEPIAIPADKAGGLVYAPHWFDNSIIFSGKLGREAPIELVAKKLHAGHEKNKMYAEQVAPLKSFAQQKMGDIAVMVGACGICYDINERLAYRIKANASLDVRPKSTTLSILEKFTPRRTSKTSMRDSTDDAVLNLSKLSLVTAIGDRSRAHSREVVDGPYGTVLLEAMDAAIRTLEENCVSFALWDYCASHSDAQGSGWNNEDTSIFSSKLVANQLDPFSGGRALSAIVRPYAMIVAGVPTAMHFDVISGTFELVFETDPEVQSTVSEIFAPKLQYPLGVEIEISDGSYECQPHVLSDVAWVVRYTHAPQVRLHRMFLRDPRPQEGGGVVNTEELTRTLSFFSRMQAPSEDDSGETTDKSAVKRTSSFGELEFPPEHSTLVARTQMKRVKVPDDFIPGSSLHVARDVTIVVSDKPGADQELLVTWSENVDGSAHDVEVSVVAISKATNEDS